MSTQLSQALRVETEIVSSAAPFFLDQAGGFQHLKVLRHRRATHRKLAGELADSRRPTPQQVDNGLPSRVRECAKHLPSVNHTLP
jgi:hypothetical protein